jgi:hypothetical protein
VSSLAQGNPFLTAWQSCLIHLPINALSRHKLPGQNHPNSSLVGLPANDLNTRHAATPKDIAGIVLLSDSGCRNPCPADQLPTAFTQTISYLRFSADLSQSKTTPIICCLTQGGIAIHILHLSMMAMFSYAIFIPSADRGNQDESAPSLQTAV